MTEQALPLPPADEDKDTALGRIDGAGGAQASHGNGDKDEEGPESSRGHGGSSPIVFSDPDLSSQTRPDGLQYPSYIATAEGGWSGGLLL